MPRRPAMGSSLVLSAATAAADRTLAGSRAKRRVPHAAEPLETRRLLSTTYYVATSGNDANAGTALTAPFRTIQRAANLAGPGDTVLVRGGTYRESLGTISKKVNLQAYPHEKVWINGAAVLANLKRAGNAWVRTGWSPRICRSGPNSASASNPSSQGSASVETPASAPSGIRR